MKTHVYGHSDEAVAALGDATAAALQAAIVTRCEGYLVAAGGATFISVYRYLADAHANTVDWNKVTVFLGDERVVPHNDPLSNGKMVRDEFIGCFPENGRPRFMPIITGMDAHSAASAYDLILPDYFDVTLLGLGSDGHTASLFSNSRSCWDANELVTVSQGELPPMVTRISLTPTAFSRSSRVYALAVGASKAEIVPRIVQDTTKKYPLSFICPVSGDVELFLDADSASQL